MKSEKPPYINLDAKDAGLPANLEIRHYPKTKTEYEFLKFQIGIMGTRPEMQPVLGEKNMIIGEEETSRTVNIFFLMAWGSSLKNAKDMFFANKEGIEK